jgi:hypothetical protein
VQWHAAAGDNPAELLCTLLAGPTSEEAGRLLVILRGLQGAERKDRP